MDEARRETRRPYVPPRVTFPSAERLAPAGGASGSVGRVTRMGSYGGPS
jgi:hypothetical protein